MIEYKNILTGVFEKVSGLKEERLSAGTRYRLMGLVADITEAVQTLQQEVLERVSREAVLDADVDIDYTEMSELTKSVELPERADADQPHGPSAEHPERQTHSNQFQEGNDQHAHRWQ